MSETDEMLLCAYRGAELMAYLDEMRREASTLREAEMIDIARQVFGNLDEDTLRRKADDYISQSVSVELDNFARTLGELQECGLASDTNTMKAVTDQILRIRAAIGSRDVDAERGEIDAMYRTLYTAVEDALTLNRLGLPAR